MRLRVRLLKREERDALPGSGRAFLVRLPRRLGMMRPLEFGRRWRPNAIATHFAGGCWNRRRYRALVDQQETASPRSGRFFYLSVPSVARG
jgi:hypothetical protein